MLWGAEIGGGGFGALREPIPSPYTNYSFFFKYVLFLLAPQFSNMQSNLMF